EDLPLVETTSRLRPQLLGRMTQRAVVEALRGNGPMSRAEISRITGISATTVSSAITQVLRGGYVEEADAEIVGPGRPGKLLRLSTDASQVIGVSVEPEWCEMVAGSLGGQQQAERHARFPTPNTYARLLAEIERIAKGWIHAPGVQTFGVGLSLPGLVDTLGGRAVFSPNLHQTDEQQPAQDLFDRLGLPVVILQESDALCLSERQVHRTDNLAILDYSGGLGVARIVAGRLLKRHFGLPNELGHVTVDPQGLKCGCGNIGCLETLATDQAFARLVSERIGHPMTPDEVYSMIQAGTLTAGPEADRVLEYLAIAIAAAVNLFAPPILVLHGRFLEALPERLPTLAARAESRILAPYRGRCQLVLSTTTKAQGALAGILDHLFEGLGPMLPAADGALK
ncbi:MAG: ROK family protein, partial [Gemmataceae bacterium]